MRIWMIFMRISLFFSEIEHDWNENKDFIDFLEMSLIEK
ncbi:hypothetical protein SLEP1_g18979 [Rubroshorea leprosula]|uniref:Uncharacterized protein n=1 Tax=Rubroshorea leprosula TaxID=152421 RepID=A0AAV5JB48_9ROSI|nr:hypothetical protein SLEP1_g18979 [Rubroshorea leprosula]